MSDPRPNIWQLQIQSDIVGLTKALSFDEADVRRRAAIALRALGAPSSIPALEAALSQEKDDDVRSAIIDALDFLMQDDSKAQQEKIVEHIAKLGSDNHDEIIEAARALGQLNDKMASEPLVILFHNSTMPPRVRLAAAEALILLSSAPTEVTLLLALRSKEWQTRRRAAAVMGQLRTDWAVEPLTAALKDPNEMVAKTAYAALKRIQTPLPATKPSPEQSTASKAKTRPLTPPADFAELSLPDMSKAADQTQPQRKTMLIRLQTEDASQQPPPPPTAPLSAASSPAPTIADSSEPAQTSQPAATADTPVPSESTPFTSPAETSAPARVSEPTAPPETLTPIESAPVPASTASSEQEQPVQPAAPPEAPVPTPADVVADNDKPPVAAPSLESDITRPTKTPGFQTELLASNSASDEKPQETATLPQTESLKPAGDDAPEKS